MFTYHQTPFIAEQVARIESLRSEVDLRGPMPRTWLGRTRRDLEAEATAASVRIEGVSVTADEARRILVGDRPATVSPADAAETLGYRDAMSLVMSRADDAGFIWQRELLLSIHRSVLGGSFAAEAGRLRRVQNWLSDSATGNQVYLPPAPEAVPDLTDELCAWLMTTTEPAPVAAALAHIRLAAIHPFRDGNGRTARILSTLVMYRGGYRAPQFTSLEEWWGRHIPQYYAAFECLGDSFSDDSDVTPFVSAHVGAHAVQAEALSLRNLTERALWTVLADVVEHDLAMHERATHALYDAIFGREVTNRYYRGMADVSDVTAVQDLRRLSAAGLLAPRGAGRSARYVGTPRLVTCAAEQLDIDPSRLPAGSLCEAADALVTILATRLQGGEVREGSVPYCARPHGD